MPNPRHISIRPLHSIEDLDQAITLQHRVWGYNDLEIESRGVLTVACRFSGQMLGAFDGTAMVGFSLAFVALERDSLHSHRVGVLDEYQNAGIGKMLKLAQREDAIRQGFRSIHWTFDPLQARNAYFNLMKLGGYSRSYYPNLYGVTSSPLHNGMPTDRLLIEWDLESKRVHAALAGESLPLSAQHIRVAFAPAAERQTPAAQETLRLQLQQAFSGGYSLTNFDRTPGQEHYLLEKL
ncbi:MAG: GNAT family N-acetyltransferase [Acidobacteriaceae bacterium]|nr:GNAT family N-acetyltransferase [Acidobacteriaceae bacterium]